MRGTKRLRSDAGFSDAFPAISEAMQNSLGQQLEALGPDVGLRLENLRSLISSLTPDETRFMKLHLQSLPAQPDIVSLFPTDILVEISPYLCVVDIVNIFNVSKAWRKAWSQRDVVRALAKHHMPNFLQFYAHNKRLRSPEDCTDEDLLKAFHQAARKRSIRQQGLFKSMISNTRSWFVPGARDRFFTLDPTDNIKDWNDVFPFNYNYEYEHPLFSKTDEGRSWAGQDAFRDSSFRYCNGRVAWQPHHLNRDLASLTFVDDLRTQRRKVFKVPVSVVLHALEEPTLRALSENLVVVQFSRTWFVSFCRPSSLYDTN